MTFVGDREDHVTDIDHQLLRVREVANVMRVSTMTVYRLIHAGDLQATRVGRSYRIFERDVMAYLARGSA